MLDYKNDKVLRQALTAVNRIRKGQGEKPLAELPKGHRLGVDCPICRAVGLVITYDQVYSKLDARASIGPTPPAIKRFIKQFDMGNYPELDIDWTPDYA